MNLLITQEAAERLPYLLSGPALISFSGGRTSGYMLFKILEANGGLPTNVYVTFANTGRERLETLDFIHKCATNWKVPIRWLEYDAQHQFREVNYVTASRDGTPYLSLIRKKKYLPNPVTRFCTIELKIRVMRDFARSLGWEHWTNVIGFRSDEMNRVVKMSGQKERWISIAPMAVAGVTKEMVMDFWRTQPFDLRLKEHEGNCDLCFLKGAKKISAIMRDDPYLANWWIEIERQTGKTFRIDRPAYAEMLAAVKAQDEFDFGVFDDLGSCASNMCTD
jgi:3'-phosphoadenosine 5'-phosphosulfate sulfotransferase (PAPS reductase)/FAD synthetase